MWIIFRFFIWFFAIIGVVNFVQTGWIYLEYDQPKNIVFVRNDSVPVRLKDVVCSASAPLGDQLVDMAIFSAATYSKEDFSLLQRLSPGWEKLELTEADRSSLLLESRYLA